MTATVALRTSTTDDERRGSRRSSSARRRASARGGDRRAIPQLSPRMQMARVALLVLFMVSFTLLLELLVVSGVQQSAAQERAFDSFRGQLARGTVAIGPTDANGKVLPLGTSVAYLEIPSIDLQQVVGEGTTPSVLFTGPGHRRDTPLPGQLGTSIVFGRHAAFGGPFERISELKQGDAITVTTGQGAFTFKVLGVRRAGDPLPPALGSGGARLTLVTAAGRAFMPDGVLRVDADLDGTAVVGPARLISASSLPPQERTLGGDARTLWVLAFWLQAMIILSIGAVWAWHRWGRAQAWVVFLPPLLLVGLAASGEAARLLPNLL